MMEYPPQYQHNQHPHLQGGYQNSPQSAGPGSLTSPSGPQSHMQQHNPNQASPILPSQTQSHYQPQSAGSVHQSMGYPQYSVPGGLPQGYGISPTQAAAMATAAASGMYSCSSFAACFVISFAHNITQVKCLRFHLASTCRLDHK